MQYCIPVKISVKIPNSFLTRKQQQRLANDDDTDSLLSDRLSGRKRPFATPK